MKSIRVTTVFLLFGFLSQTVLATEEPDSDNAPISVIKGTPAVAIEKVPPVYPHDMIQRGIEGWVQVGFVVDEDGSTRDIRVLNNSEELSFDRAAISAVSKWKFKPATWGGKPVPETKLRQRLVFIMESANPNVSRRFRSRLTAAYKAMEEGDLEKARGLIDKLERDKQYLLSENCWLDIVEGDYWEKAGDNQRALKHYERAIILADDFTTESAYKQLLRSGIVLNAKLGRLAPALDHYEALDELEQGLAADDPMNNIERKIRQFIEGEQPYVTQGEIKLPCETCTGIEPTFYHKLLRDRLTVNQVEGELSELKFLCGISNVSVTYEPDMAWDINKAWGDCYVQVEGEPGTTFQVVEL